MEIIITIIICMTVIAAILLLQAKPITIVLHKKFEEIKAPSPELTAEEKKLLEDQQSITDGMNELIKATQEFLGGDIDDADAE